MRIEGPHPAISLYAESQPPELMVGLAAARLAERFVAIEEQAGIGPFTLVLDGLENVVHHFRGSERLPWRRSVIANVNPSVESASGSLHTIDELRHSVGKRIIPRFSVELYTDEPEGWRAVARRAIGITMSPTGEWCAVRGEPVKFDSPARSDSKRGLTTTVHASKSGAQFRRLQLQGEDPIATLDDLRLVALALDQAQWEKPESATLGNYVGTLGAKKVIRRLNRMAYGRKGGLSRDDLGLSDAHPDVQGGVLLPNGTVAQGLNINRDRGIKSGWFVNGLLLLERAEVGKNSFHALYVSDDNEWHPDLLREGVRQATRQELRAAPVIGSWIKDTREEKRQKKEKPKQIRR